MTRADGRRFCIFLRRGRFNSQWGSVMRSKSFLVCNYQIIRAYVIIWIHYCWLIHWRFLITQLKSFKFPVYIQVSILAWTTICHKPGHLLSKFRPIALVHASIMIFMSLLSLRLNMILVRKSIRRYLGPSSSQLFNSLLLVHSSLIENDLIKLLAQLPILLF